MGLDLYIKTNRPIKHHTTGVFIRKNGMNIELKTVEEVLKYFPNADQKMIEEYEYENDAAWCKHITHNLTEMARNVSLETTDLYKLLWHPNENGYLVVNDLYVSNISRCLSILKGDRERLESFNSENGFGNYESLFSFTSDLYEFLISIDYINDIYRIYANV